MTTLDDLELELRKLPGVRATGFTERDDVLLVQVHVGDEYHEPTLPLQATRIAYRHSDRPVAVELVRWRTRDVHGHETAGRVESGATVAAPTASESMSSAAPSAPPPSAPAPATPAPATYAEPPRRDTGAVPTAFGAGDTYLDVPPAHTAEPPRETAPVAPPAPPVGEQAFVTREPSPAPRAPEPEPVVTPTAPEAASGAVRVNRRSGSGSDEDRVRLLAVLTFPETDELEVHLTLQGRRTIGRAAASRGLLASVEATLDALGAFVPGLAYQPAWARTLETSTGEGFLVAAGLAGPESDAPRHGLAAGSSAIEAAARATLQALNRSIALEIAATGEQHRGESA